MNSLRTETPPSASTTVPPYPQLSPPKPTDEDIEAVIQLATSSRSSPDGRLVPLKDTRTQLFVGNLPYRVRWQDLKDLFRKAGTVLRADVSLGPDNRSRGHGTVLLATAEDAGRAIDMFHGYTWQTRVLEVRPDRLPPDFDNPLGLPTLTTPTLSLPSSPLYPLHHDLDYGILDRPQSADGGRNLFVGNLPFHCQWQDLKDLFRQAGTIVRADVVLGPDGRSRGFGTVVFANEYDADRALRMFNGYEYNGRQLKVHHDKFIQTGSPTQPLSPALSAYRVSASHLGHSESSAHQNQTLSFSGGLIPPPGYSLDYGPPSEPHSPYDPYPPGLGMKSLGIPLPSRSQATSPRQVDLVTATLASMTLPPTRTPRSGPPLETGSRDSDTPPSSDSQKLPRNPSTSPNPHHPGHIAIPPTTFGIPMPPNMSPGFMAMSPMYHNGSPLHHPAMVPFTPHGLPPMTPSMPPFTFAPAHPSMMPSPTTASFPSSVQNPAVSTALAALGADTPMNFPSPAHRQAAPQPHSATQARSAAEVPRPGIGGFFPHPGVLPAHLTPFSPGLVMSPGAFWGRPGVAGAGPNPFINPAVGAPVHHALASHGSTPTGYFFVPSPSAHPLATAATNGSMAEPGGYFDQYFAVQPPVVQQVDSMTLEDSIMKEKRPEGDSERSIFDNERDWEDRNDDGDDDAHSNSNTDTTHSTTITPPTSTDDPDEDAVDDKDDDFHVESKQTAGVLRAQSMSSSAVRPTSGLINIHRGDSEPVPAATLVPSGPGST